MFAFFTVLYVITLMVTHGTYIQTKLTEDGCVNEYAFEGPAVDVSNENEMKSNEWCFRLRFFTVRLYWAAENREGMRAEMT